MGMAVVTDELRASRARVAENALASGRMEGLEPSAGAMSIFQRFIDGELSLEEMSAAVKAYAQREYGSVRLPGH